MASKAKSGSAPSKQSKKFKKIQKDLGRRIKELREEQGLTLEELSELAGMDWRHLHKAQSGELNLTLFSLHRIAEAFGVEIEDLFT